MNKLPLTAQQQAAHHHDRLSQTDSSLVSNAHTGQDIFNEVHGSSALQLLPAMYSFWIQTELLHLVLPCGGSGKSLSWASYGAD